ncbi:MAG: DUF2085 domain-containing protein [Melioribacteraceae bacterium]|nr:DUF2085 domain-containing protein [Melioribacteraceae bacterium]
MKLLIKIVFLFFITIWCIGIFNQFLFEKGTSNLISLLSDNVYSNVCHQNPGRLISESGNHSMVCSRCAGIYSGVLLFSIILLFLCSKSGLSIYPLFIGLLPMLADVILTSLDIYEYSKTIAFITGLLSGSVVIFYIHDAINKLFIELRSEDKT